MSVGVEASGKGYRTDGCVSSGHHDLDEVADISARELFVGEQGLELGAGRDLVEGVLLDLTLLGRTGEKVK